MLWVHQCGSLMLPCDMSIRLEPGLAVAQQQQMLHGMARQDSGGQQLLLQQSGGASAVS